MGLCVVCRILHYVIYTVLQCVVRSILHCALYTVLQCSSVQYHSVLQCAVFYNIQYTYSVQVKVNVVEQ